MEIVLSNIGSDVNVMCLYEKVFLPTALDGLKPGYEKKLRECAVLKRLPCFVGVRPIYS